MKINQNNDFRELDIAVVGMDCKFPGAGNYEEFWNNICEGKESLTWFSEEELKEAGVPERLLNNPDYIKAAFVLDGVENFDASFFGFTPKEAKLMDPQQRVLLEASWHALEDAGYSTDDYDGNIGVFVGAGISQYLMRNVMSNYDLDQTAELRTIWIENDLNYLSTMLSYKLNLTGPSINLQTACSTALTAIATACQSLLSYQCDMAVAGGCRIVLPQKAGYLYTPGEVLSPDGHCRPFDKDGQGTLIGSGVGVVVLKRLTDAVADRDNIIAVVKGSAVNNDGNSKVGFTAPSITGERRAIMEAFTLGEVNPESISYVEAHGTATVLGDPIEVQALTEAFRTETDEKQFCALGSVKANIGHLDTAAGAAGFIKTCLMLQHGIIPPSINYNEPNVNINFLETPFYVNTKKRVWEGEKFAGVSSFGIGGTNVHIVLEDAVNEREVLSRRNSHLIMMSGKTKDAVKEIAQNLSKHLETHEDADYRNAAFTMNTGRKALPYRSFITASSRRECIDKLMELTRCTYTEGHSNGIVFMFPGQGSQYIGMAKSLYESEAEFRKIVSECSKYLEQYIGYRLEHLLFESNNNESNQLLLRETKNTHVALFVIEYAVAKLLMHWGIMPQALIGHSIGEYTAACISGVISLEDSLRLMAERGKIIQSLRKGAMLSVRLSKEEAAKYCTGSITLAVENTNDLVVLSGSEEDITELEKQLEGTVVNRRLHTSHGFHSSMLKEGAEPFRAVLETIEFHEPKIPYMSNVTGDWVKAEDIMKPDYWVQHMLTTVQFKTNAERLVKDNYSIYIEVGPGSTLTTFLRSASAGNDKAHFFETVPKPDSKEDSAAFLMNTLGSLWSNGVKIDKKSFYEEESLYRIQLCGYPFKKEYHWLEEASLVRIPSEQSHEKEEDESARAEEMNLIEENRNNLSSDYAAPENPMEESLVEVLEDIIGIHPIGVLDNFFELGGHSLSASQVVSRIRDLYEIELNLNEFMENPTVRQVADVLFENMLENYEED